MHPRWAPPLVIRTWAGRGPRSTDLRAAGDQARARAPYRPRVYSYRSTCSTTTSRPQRTSLPMNYFSRFHVHAGSRMVDAGAQTCTAAHGRLDATGLCTATATRDPPGPARAETQDSSPSRLDGGRSRRAVAREAAGPKWRRRRGCSACGAFQPLEGRSRSVRFRRHRSYKGCAVSMLKGKTNIEPASEVVRSSRPP